MATSLAIPTQSTLPTKTDQTALIVAFAVIRAGQPSALGYRRLVERFPDSFG